MKTVAVVEDNRDNRLLLRLFLSGIYRLTEYMDGFSALEGMKRAVPDVVLLDISLPGLDGIGVLSRIRAEAALREVPVIAITAHAMAGDREGFFSAGFDDYISKPIVDEAELIATIERAIQRPTTVVGPEGCGQ